MSSVFVPGKELPTAPVAMLFQFSLVAQTAADASHDTCKQTCKLECHSGSPVMDEELDEDFAL